MARTQNLSEYLTDIATAIKAKKGDETPINASKFDEEIANLPTGGGVDEYFEESSSETSQYFVNKIIKKIPMIDTSQVKSMSSGFRYCENLEEIPLLDTSNVTNMSNMFYNCISLKTIPLLDTSNVTIMSSIFDNCTSLEEIPLLDTSKVTTLNSAFRYCNFKKLPQFNTSSLTEIGNAFYSNKGIEEIPLLDFGNVTGINTMLYSCTNLTTLGGFKDLGKAYGATSSANNNNFTLDLSRAGKLTYESLMNVINNLYDISDKNTQKLVLGNTYKNKLTAEEIQICTDKGWSVS